MDLTVFEGLRGPELTARIDEVGREATVRAMATALGERINPAAMSQRGITIEASAMTPDGVIVQRVRCNRDGVEVLSPDDPEADGDPDVTFVGQHIEDGVLIALKSVRPESLFMLGRGTIDGRPEALLELAQAAVIRPEDDSSQLTLLGLLELWPLTRRELDKTLTDDVIGALFAEQQDIVADMITMSDVGVDLDDAVIEFAVHGPERTHRSHLVVEDAVCTVDTHPVGAAHLTLTWKRGAEYVQWLLGKVRAADAAVTGMIAIDGDVSLLTPMLRLPEPSSLLDSLPDGLRPDVLGG